MYLNNGKLEITFDGRKTLFYKLLRSIILFLNVSNIFTEHLLKQSGSEQIKVIVLLPGVLGPLISQ